jgi:hypothetical protein
VKSEDQGDTEALLSCRHLEMESGESHSGRWWSLQEATSSVGGTVAALLISTLVAYVAVMHHRRKKLPPGPWPWPVVGNLGVLSGLPHRNLQQLAAKHGGLMYLQLGESCALAG